MKALIIGGTGVISTDFVQIALEKGWDITLLNRGQRPLPAGVCSIECDAHDERRMREVLRGKSYDAVANFIGYLPETIEQDIRLFDGKCGQYLFISSCAVYQKPSGETFTTESSPLRNVNSPYGQRKIACEEMLNHAYREKNFPITIIRPNWTYNRETIPFIFSSWKSPWTLIDRMQKGLPIIVPGDGTSRFTITHARDFGEGMVGLLGNRNAVGHSFHITGDEAPSWNECLAYLELATGYDAHIVHISADFICKVIPSLTADLIGDKITTFLFDNTKIKRFAPEFCAKTSYQQGVGDSIEYLRAHPELQGVDQEYVGYYDKVLAAYPA